MLKISGIDPEWTGGNWSDGWMDEVNSPPVLPVNFLPPVRFINDCIGFYYHDYT